MEVEVMNCQSSFGEGMPVNIAGLLLPVTYRVGNRAREGRLVGAEISH